MNRFQSEYPHLRVIPKWVPSTDLLYLRNFFAFQSALIRGDETVTLHNRQYLFPEHEVRVRVPYVPANHPQYRSQARPFKAFHGEEQPEDYQEPMNLDDFIPSKYWDGFELTWIKVLGEGGFGMATLWEAEFEDGSRRKVVIKLPITENANFKDELDWHLRYKGASHIVQAMDLQGIANNIKYGYNPEDQEEPFDQVDLGVLVLEFAEHGSFLDVMSKASHYGIKFSNKTLWEIWECLVKGVVSAAYQPDMDPGRLDDILNSLDDPETEDRVEWLLAYQISHDVHFDLEEQNILVGEDPNHPHNPIFKLHDFGAYSRKMPECWATWDEERYWNCRKCPKTNRIPPETIVKEWDEVDMKNPGDVSRFHGDDFTVGNTTAGRYGSWTNVFLIAKVMEGVISGNWLSHPMTSAKYTSLDDTITGDTYGWRLTKDEYRRVDPYLIDQIMQCQFERPQDRPSLISLLQAIMKRKKQGFVETDEQTRGFWNRFWQITTGDNVGLSSPGGGPGGSPGGGPGPGPAPAQPAQRSDLISIVASTSGNTSNEDDNVYHSAGSGPSFHGKGKGVVHPSRSLPYAALGNPVVSHVASLRQKSKEKRNSRQKAALNTSQVRVPGAWPNLIDDSIPSSFGRKTAWQVMGQGQQAAPGSMASSSPLIDLGSSSPAQQAGAAIPGRPETPIPAQGQQKQQRETSSAKRRAQNYDLYGQSPRKIPKNDANAPRGIQQMMARAAKLEKKIASADLMDLDS